MFNKSDWHLIQKALSGSERSWSKLVRRYQSEVFNHAFRMTGSEQDAFDLMQEIFLSVFRNLPGFRGDAQFRTWLYRIASNRSIDFLRKRKLPVVENDKLYEHSDNNHNENIHPQHQQLQQQQSYKQWKINVLTTFCEYAPYPKNLPKREHLSFIFNHASYIDNKKADTIVVLSNAQLKDCRNGKINGTQLLKSAEQYDF